jgi:SAM-dependent methyltransferase
VSDLRTLQKSWDEAGQADPLWAILTAPGKEGGRWDLEEFFVSGREEISAALQYVASLGLPSLRGRALDFGCGVGRLTQALAEHFDEADGVDIAPSMVEQARELNRHGDRCRYHVNAEPDLRLFPDSSFDFVYSNLVLQHVGPELACAYMREFVRVLAPGGVALFQLPSEPVEPAQQSAACSPLPADAFRARLVPERSRISGSPGARLALRVHVVNESATTWPVAGSPGGHDAVNLGNHWRTRRGRLIVLDDGRCGLPAPLPPGGEVELTLHVTLPTRAGVYVLELDLVQEHVAWFADRGSATARLRADVGPRAPFWGRRARARAEEGGLAWSREALAMHGVPKERVLALLTDAGARVLDVEENRAAGSGWVSFRYAVTKAAGAERRPEPRG